MLDLAKDAQVGLVDYEYKKVDYVRSYQPEPDIKKDRIKAAADLINEAKKPFCLVGQGVLLGGAEEELKAFLQKMIYLPDLRYWAYLRCQPISH